MGHFSLIIVVAALIGGSYLFFNMKQTTFKADEELAGYHMKSLAREQAKTGLNLVERQLLDAVDLWETTTFGFAPTSYGGGTFEADIDLLAPDTVEVTSRGNHVDGSHTIIARYTWYWSIGGLPPFMQYAIAANGNLTLNGNVTVGHVHEEMGVAIHTNGTLTVSGNAAEIGGDGTYGPEGVYVGNEGVFDGSVASADSVEIPLLDPWIYSDIAHEYHPNGYVIPGNPKNQPPLHLDFYELSNGMAGTPDNPYIVFIIGDLDMEQHITYSGHGIIVTTGDIDVSGNFSVTSTDNTDEVSLGLYAGGDITLSGQGNDNQLEAFLYSNGQITFNGNIDLIGGAVTADQSVDVNTLVLNGNVTVTYTEASESLVPPGIDVQKPLRLRLLAYSEW